MHNSEKESIHPLKGEDKYTIYFFLKVSILTLIFSICWLFLFPQEKNTYNDHHETGDLPGIPSERTHIGTTTPQQVDSIIKVIVDDALINENKEEGDTKSLGEVNIKEEHSAAYFKDAKVRYNEICSEYKNICSITTWDGSYTDHEKLMYQAILIYMFNALNDYLDTTIQNKIRYIKMYEDGDMSSRRGSATADYVKMNTQLIGSAEEFWQVLTHELGHTIDFAVVQGYSARKDATYTEFGRAKRAIDDPSIEYYRISWLDESTRRSDANFRDFVSGYGMRGMYEDLAEFNNLWLNHHAYLKSLARNNAVIEKKYRFFSSIYGKEYFKDTYKRYPDTEERVWDTTQIIDG